MTDIDERYATAREHWELREDVAGLKADMRQIGPQLTRIETMIAAKPQQAAQATPDTNSLALHNAADAMRQAVQAMANRQSGGQELAHALSQSKALKNGAIWPWFIAGMAVAAAAPMVWHQLTGH